MFLFWNAHLKLVMSIYILIPKLQNDQFFRDSFFFFFFFACEVWILIAVISVLF